MILNVLSEDADGSTAARGSEVRGRPKSPFPIAALDVWTLKAKHTTGYTFETVDQSRYGMLWRIVDVQMHRIGFAMHFEKLRFGVNTDLLKPDAKTANSILVKDPTTIFGDKEMHMHPENAMSTVTDFA